MFLPSAFAEESVPPVAWRVSGFYAGNSKWLARCKIVATDRLIELKPGEAQDVTVSDRDNNCLHLIASELRLTIVDQGSRATRDRRMDVRVTRTMINRSWFSRDSDPQIVSVDDVQLRCHQYVHTVFGLVNPVGARVLDCKTIEGSSIGLHIRFVDSSIWLR